MAANEKSLSIVIKARDEASAKMRQMQQSMKKGVMEAVGPFVAIGAAVATAAKAAASGYELMAANAAKAGAQMEGDMIGVLEAQVKVNDAWGKFGAAVPVIGGEIERIIRVLKDTEGIQKQIEGMKRLKQVTESLGSVQKSMRQEAELMKAELDGASKAQLAELKILQDQRKYEKERVELYRQRQAAMQGLENSRESMLKILLLEERGVKAPLKFLNEQEIVLWNIRKTIQALNRDEAELTKQRRRGVEVLKEQEEAAAVKAQKEAQEKITRLLRDETENRVMTVRKEFDEALALSEKYGFKTEALERRRTAEVNRIRAEGAKREADARERVRQEEARKMMAALAKRKQELEKVARDTMTIEDVTFDATHGKREQDLRDLGQWLKEKRDIYAGNQEVLAKVEQAGLIRRAQIEADALEQANQKRATPAEDKGTEVAAFTSRFLTQAPGREKPAWVRDVTGATDEQTKALKEVLEAMGTKLAAAFLEQRPEVGAIA